MSGFLEFIVQEHDDAEGGFSVQAVDCLPAGRPSREVPDEGFKWKERVTVPFETAAQITFRQVAALAEEKRTFAEMRRAPYAGHQEVAAASMPALACRT